MHHKACVPGQMNIATLIVAGLTVVMIVMLGAGYVETMEWRKTGATDLSFMPLSLLVPGAFVGAAAWLLKLRRDGFALAAATCSLVIVLVLGAVIKVVAGGG